MSPVDYQKLFSDVHRRPGAYGLDGSYPQAVAFVMGCDAGNDWGLLISFPEWLALQAGGGRNLVWSSLVLRIALPTRPDVTPATILDPQHNEQAVETLFRLLNQFLTELRGARGATEIISRYLDSERSGKQRR